MIGDAVMHCLDTRGDCLLVITSIQLKVKWSCFVWYFISRLIAGESHEMKVLICQLGPSHKHPSLYSVHSDPVSAWRAASHNAGPDLIIPTNLTQSVPYRQTDSQTLNTCTFPESEWWLNILVEGELSSWSTDDEKRFLVQFSVKTSFQENSDQEENLCFGINKPGEPCPWCHKTETQ